MYTKELFTSKIEENAYNGIIEEQESIGYYRLPESDTFEIKEYAKNIDKKDIVVIGIGGSSLGPSAIYEFLKITNKYEKKLHFLESTDPINLKYKVDSLDLSNSLFIVISKSGGTLETISIFKYILSLVDVKDDNFLVITENDSNLKLFADSKNIKTFDIPKDVGGRFSVFSPVGLLPLAIIGIDIDNLLSGAKEVRDSFMSKDDYYKAVMNKAIFYGTNYDKYSINCLFSYSELLREFNKWYIQLWGESLGKIQKVTNKNIGLTPIGLVGPVDQHSFLQLIVEGTRDKTVTFIKIMDFESDLKVTDISLKNLESTDNINGLEFAKIINLQADSIIESLKDNKIPIDLIEIDTISERSIGRLMFYFELLTSVTGQIMNVNSYNQPGVEDGKIRLKEMLKELS